MGDRIAVISAACAVLEPMEQRVHELEDLVHNTMLAGPHVFVGDDPVAEITRFAGVVLEGRDNGCGGLVFGRVVDRNE